MMINQRLYTASVFLCRKCRGVRLHPANLPIHHFVLNVGPLNVRCSYRNVVVGSQLV
jgi:hypothetical protein